MKNKHLYIRCVYLWVILSIVLGEYLVINNVEYDDNPLATVIYATSAIWGFPIWVEKKILGMIGVDLHRWIEYILVLIVCALIIELLLGVSDRRRSGQKLIDENDD